MYEGTKVFKMELAGRPLVVETNKYGDLAGGAVMVRYGETVIMAAATASAKPRDGIDFLPLSVDYEERLYAVGKIPGSFLKREGRPTEKAILTSRVIDRPIRPLFPKDLRNDVGVVLTVLSVDPDCSPEITAMIGASIALSVSDIPWNGPIGGVSVGLVDGKLIVNPGAQDRLKSKLNLTVASSKNKVVMIEAGADMVDDETMFEAIMLADKEIKNIVTFIEDMQAQVGKKKIEYPSCEVDGEMYEAVKALCIEDIKYALYTDDKNVREERLKPVYEKMFAHFDEIYPERKSELNECMYKLQKYVVRRWMLDEGKRVDGRGINDLRPLHSEVGILPRVHGSGLFARGQTQVLTIATLAPVSEQQKLDGLDADEEFKRYMHHYNMPSYSVGETRPSRGPGRREIGHGALAERALDPVIPSEDEFPYAIRLVSEIISSNGSTSQGSICGSTLALMDAGVPLKAPVAGISCGLVTEGDKWITMTDIQGLEDFFGDMDFKVAGTKDGITAIQMDLKIDGLTPEIIKKALEQTHTARMYILDEVMLKAIAEPRKELSKYAPKMIMMTIDPDKIREVIGSGGKVIQKIVADTGAKIDIEDDGRVFIAAINQESGLNAQKIIELIVNDPEPGDLYMGKVTRVMTFGAFVEIGPGKEGMVHISKLENYRVEKIEDVCKVGDEFMVKVMEIDEKGRINLSKKDAVKKTEN